MSTRSLRTFTIDDLKSWGPCGEYTDELIEHLFAGRESLNALDVLDLDIPDGDKLWCVLREELLDAPLLREFACRCAERVLPHFAAMHPNDNRPHMAIEASRRFSRGEISRDELSAARDAARAAARDAPDASAAAAARAAWAARDAWAARAAEIKSQADILRCLIGPGDEHTANED